MNFLKVIPNSEAVLISLILIIKTRKLFNLIFKIINILIFLQWDAFTLIYIFYWLMTLRIRIFIFLGLIPYHRGREMKFYFSILVFTVAWINTIEFKYSSFSLSERALMKLVAIQNVRFIFNHK